jgi:MoxR-like ATPase
LLARRNHVLPEDVQAIWIPVVNHRLRGTQSGGARAGHRELAAQLLASVAIP